MHEIQLLFFTGIVITLYAYLGYGLIVYTLVKFKNTPSSISLENYSKNLPDLTLVIFAYNEASCIQEKIVNSLALSYPAWKKQVLVVTDGSTDETPDIARRFKDIQVLHQPERKGKTAALNRAMQHVTTEIVVFTDANTWLHPETLMRLAAYYRDPQVGGVAGEKRVKPIEENAVGQGESLYWKYESWLKRLDAMLYTVVGAAGELFSIRTALFEPLPEDTILDDFVLSLQIVQKGFRFAYAPEAWSIEAPSASLRDEQKRKIRICAGGFQAMGRLLPLLNIFKYKIASFQYISHRVLRWAVVPFLLPGLFILNLILMWQHAGLAYEITGYGQITFYTLAGVGFLFAMRNKKIKGIYPFYYFLLMNIAVYIGLWKLITGKQKVKWEKANRYHSLLTTYTISEE
ncbi:MAG: glycosyltransferase family 2 protein [Thermoflavifilum sp.]|nr:glycosyltransferase family 2 protein [Thermoflavifilum sp.]